MARRQPLPAGTRRTRWALRTAKVRGAQRIRCARTKQDSVRPKQDSVRLCARSRLKLTLLRLLRVQCGRGTGGARAAGYDYYGYDLVQNGVDALNAEECGFHCLTYACVRARALRASICVRISCAVSQWSSTAGCTE